MRKLFGYLLSPAGLLFIFVTIGQFAYAVYLTSGAWEEPTPAFSFIYATGFLWILTRWFLTDSCRRGLTWAFDMGMFLYMVWPFFMTYYLIKTRRAKGLVVIFGFLGVYIAAWLAGLAVSLLLFPNATWPE